MNAKAPQQSCSYTTLRSLNVGCRAGFLGHVGARDHVMSSFSGRGLAPKALTISGALQQRRHAIFRPGYSTSNQCCSRL